MVQQAEGDLKKKPKLHSAASADLDVMLLQQLRQQQPVSSPRLQRWPQGGSHAAAPSPMF